MTQVFLQASAAVVLLLLFCIQVQCALPVWNEGSSVQVNEGDDLTLTCATDISNWMDMVHIFKDVDDTKYSISEKTTLKDEFADQSRYSVSGSSEVTLTIQGIKGADAGRIGCEKKSERLPVYIDVIVKVPVTDLYFVSIDGDGAETRIDTEVTPSFTLTQGRSSGIGCVSVVNGSSEQPTTAITIGDVDETAAFTPHPDTTVLNPDSGLSESSVVVKYLYTTDQPNSNQNGKTLTCTSRVVDTEPRSVEIQVNVHYKPVITCTNTRYRVKEGAAVDVTCTVKANPTANVTWYDNTDDVIMSADDATKGWSIDTQSLGDGSTEVTLIFESINNTMDHFRDYRLESRNAVGGAEQIITVEEHTGQEIPVEQPDSGGVVDPGNSGPSLLHTTTHSIVVCALMLLCTHWVVRWGTH